MYLFTEMDGLGSVFCDSDQNKVSYEGYQVWTAQIGGRNLSSEVTDKIFKKDVWRSDENSTDFLLNGNETSYWKSFLESHNISYTVLFDNVQNILEDVDRLKPMGARRVDWVSYSNLNEINSYLKSKADAYPKNCILSSIGSTAHKKEIKMMKVTNGKIGNEAILIESGMHGREWSAVSTVLYFIEYLTANFSALPRRIRHHDWYIIPVLNPDGYEYAMSKDRMWRKNRRRFSGPCDGVDLNRNFDAFWGHIGSSPDICGNDYSGPFAFSEQETLALKGLVERMHFKVYVSVHSFGTAIHYPWASSGKASPSIQKHVFVSKELSKAMSAVKHRHFKAGPVVRHGSGMSIDWMYQQGVEHSYLLETRGLTFQLKSQEILPAAMEVTAALKRLAELL